MSESTSFSAMASDALGDIQIPTIGVGLIGYAMMGRAHSNAYKVLQHVAWPPPMVPRLEVVAGRNEGAVNEAARRYGFDRAVTDWRELVDDPRVQLVDNSGTNSIHLEPCLAALEAGKHVICEKPLGRTADESFVMYEAAVRAGVKHMTSFNYRFVPAIRLIRDLIDSGKLGKIYHFRAAFLQEWIADPNLPMVWRLNKAESGSGVLGDLGAHVVDLARYLVGEISAVSGQLTTFVKERGGETVEVDDACSALLQFESGAVGVLEASRFALGRKADLTLEINGSKGSVIFDLARLNELQVSIEGSEPAADAQGFRRVIVTENSHPYLDIWFPHGHMLGWEHTFVNQTRALLTAIVNDTEVGPHGATFRDGYRAAEVCDAIAASSDSGTRVSIHYRDNNHA